jgi:cytochrome c biogenesis protein CcmG, thiol:disulfide interchange protein DsbE
MGNPGVPVPFSLDGTLIVMAPRWVGMGMLFCGLWSGCGATESIRDNKASSEQATTAENVSRQEQFEPSKSAELPPAPEPDKKIYAKSFINKPAPKFIVEEWLTKQPEMAGKMVLIDFWATWCKPCLVSIPKLNQFHRKHKDRLAIIGVSDETSETVRAHQGAKINYAVAVDTQRRMYEKLGIENIPHLIIVDPTGIVRWEGFPTLKGHELTDEVLEDLLDTYVP